MKFAAVIEYSQDKALIAEVRPAHREYLRGLKETGRLVASGPFTDDSGALIIYEAATAEEAQQLINGDPFRERGVFLSWNVRAWNPVIANLVV